MVAIQELLDRRSHAVLLGQHNPQLQGRTYRHHHGSGEYSTTTGIDTYDVSRIKAQFGVQWNAILNARRALTFGATYDIGGLLGPKSLKYVYIDNLLTSTVRNEEDTSLPLRLPRQIAAGVFYQTVSLRMVSTTSTRTGATKTRTSLRVTAPERA